MCIFAIATRAYLRDVSLAVDVSVHRTTIATRAYLRDVSESPDLSVSCCWIAARAYLRDVSYKELKPLTKQNNKKAGI